MGFYTRVLSCRATPPTFSELSEVLRDCFPSAVLSLESGEDDNWTELLLVHADGTAIAEVERCAVVAGSLGRDEINEFIDELEGSKPASAAEWLRAYLPRVATVYAFRHLSGTHEQNGDAALSAVREHVWSKGEAIFQADGEGFSNEDGYHILWQFADDAAGKWNMAVLVGGSWVSFEMDLANPRHRQAFLEGRVPAKASPPN
jgi:hypothetical protein